MSEERMAFNNFRIQSTIALPERCDHFFTAYFFNDHMIQEISLKKKFFLYFVYFTGS